MCVFEKHRKCTKNRYLIKGFFCEHLGLKFNMRLLKDYFNNDGKIISQKVFF